MPEEIKDYRYAVYPSAKVYDADGNEIQHLLWGDWVAVKGKPDSNGLISVKVRGDEGFMREDDLQPQRLLEIVFVDVGQGDGCLVVTPDDRKIIIDAGEADNMYRFLSWRFNFRGGVRTLDAAVITHPDKDHYFGFSKLFEEESPVRFKKIYHNGLMEQYPKNKPLGPEVWEDGIKYIAKPLVTQYDLETFLSEPSSYNRKLYPNLLKDALAKVEAGDNNICMLSAGADPTSPVYMDGFGKDQPVRFRVLGPVIEPDSLGNPRLRWFRDQPTGGSFNTGKTKNGHSVILKLEYGDVSILLGGDLNTSAEAFLLQHYSGIPWPPKDSNREKILIDIARMTFRSDVVKSCHHGSADFTDTFLEAINPAATVISSGDEESHAHPRSDTLGAIGLHGRGWRPLIFSTELSRSTRENEGNKREEIGRILEKIDNTDDPAVRQELVEQRDDLVNQLTRRNVTVYGAINLRTDGKKVMFAYKLERPRIGRKGKIKTLIKWDIYQMERLHNGPLIYVDKE